MKVDQLPVEILMKIFSYLTTYKKVSLVNHLFYNVACKVNDSNICVSLYCNLLEREEKLPLLQSVMNTNRKISKLRIVTVSPTDIKMLAVVKKFSSTITDLTLYSVHVEEISDFVDILSLVPNAEHLSLDYLSIRTQEPDRQLSEKKRRIDGDNEDLNLNQLKSLKCCGCDNEILVVFDRLPSGVLTEFTFDVLNFLQFGTLFKRQKHIKKLTVSDLEPFETRRELVVAVDYFDHLELESLDWHQDLYIINIASTLSKQPKLKSLSLGIVDTNVMNVVGNQLTELESLSINDISAPAAAIVNINKLKKLKYLTLLSVEDVALMTSFANLDNSRIITLDISFVTNISIDQIQALAKGAPNLKSLRCAFNSSIFSAVTRYFNFVEVLRFHGYEEPTNDNYFDQDDCIQNRKLIELIIDGKLCYDTSFMEEMIVNYPNLKKMAIKSSIPLTDSQFKRILDGFPKLESLLLITGASMLTIDALNHLNHHKNVTFISLKDFDLELGHRHFKQLSAMFDVVVNSEFYKKFAMAVDTKTMVRESLLLL